MIVEQVGSIVKWSVEEVYEMFPLGFTHSLQILSKKVSETSATVDNLGFQLQPILFRLYEFKTSHTVVDISRVILGSASLQICRVDGVKVLAVLDIVNLVTNVR